MTSLVPCPAPERRSVTGFGCACWGFALVRPQRCWPGLHSGTV